MRRVGGATPLAGKVELGVNKFGLVGADSPLPTHITDLVDESGGLPAKRLRTFLDTLHHRLYELRYMAWQKRRRQPARSGRPTDDAGRLLDALQGFDGAGHDELDERERYFRHGEALLHRNCSADHLRTALSHDFRLEEIKIEEFVETTLPIDSSDRTVVTDSSRAKYGLGDGAKRIGLNAVAGKSARVRSMMIQIELGPLPYARYAELLPGTATRARLELLLDKLLPVGVEYRLRLVLAHDEARETRVGGDGRLGWSSWIGQPSERARTVDVSGLRAESVGKGSKVPMEV